MSKFDISDRSNSSDIITINGYEIIERIGVGSYGRVYKVSKNQKYYVLKEIPLNLSSAAEKINSVQNEADILSSLNNKYVVKFYTSFKRNQNIYIIMEYCDNGDLCTFLNKIKKQRKPDDEFYLKENFVWKLFIQMSIGLYYIHSKKIIHRDIKTLNIFLTKKLDAKIGDLGVAKILENTNHAMTFIGTPYYVSPEMCRNKPYNEKSDIWALGCILYELLTFNHPFTATNQAALFIKILNNKYNPFPPDVPEDLKQMVDFILEKDYEKRPSMEDIITSKSFQYNAWKLNLDQDLKNVLGLSVLPVQRIKKELSEINNDSSVNCNNININNTPNEKNSDKNIGNNRNNINSSHTFVIHLNSSKQNKDGNIKNQRSDLINCKSLNDILQKYHLLNNKKELKNQNSNSNKYFSNKSHRSHQKIIKKNFVNSKNKRTKSDFNCLVQNNNNINTNNTNQKIETKYTENKTNKIKKKYINIIDSKFIISHKSNISPRKTARIINTTKKIKENFKKKLINNNINLNGCNININIKSDSSKNSAYIKYCETSQNRIKMNSLSKNKNMQKSKSPKIKKSSKIFLDKKINQKNDIISESEFLSELQNTIKNTQTIITLNDLLNFNFNLEDSKNLNTTSNTSLLGKKERPSIYSEEKYDLIFKNIEEEIEKENSDYLNNLCDEFTRTERIQRSEPFLRKQIPFSNYHIKINENKDELNQINEMNKDELIQTNLIYKHQYENYLEKIKKYENFISLEEIQQIYKNINDMKENDIKIILDEIINYLKNKRIPKENLDEIIDIIYNLISYEIKYKYTEKAIENVDL